MFTIAFALNFGMVQPAAHAWIPITQSAAQQEHQKEKNVRGEFGEEPRGDSEDARRLTPIFHSLQKRICDANGIEIVNEPFQNSKDYKTKIHPIKVIDDYNNGVSLGAGYIYMGVPLVARYCKSSYLNSPYDHIAIEKAIAHELTHETEGHERIHIGFRWESKRKFKVKSEEKAEWGSIRLTDTLPEGGWGVYFVAVARKMNYYEINRKIIKSFKEKTHGLFQYDTDWPERTYQASYNPKNSNKSGMLWIDFSNTPLGRDVNAYYAGQIAYCLAKDALTMDNIDIMENHLQQTLKFSPNEKYLLICRSANLPNGYRILASLKGEQKQDLEQFLYRAKNQVLQGKDFSCIQSQIYKYNPTHGDADENRWRIWYTCAIAYDASN